jgi:hypothetical protein
LKISRRQEEVVTPTSTQPQETFEDFLYSQEPWIIDLLRHLEFKVCFDEAIISLTTSTTTNLGASDGSVKFENGTWGWALSKPKGEELIECKGGVNPVTRCCCSVETAVMSTSSTLVMAVMHGDL